VTEPWWSHGAGSAIATGMNPRAVASLMTFGALAAGALPVTAVMRGLGAGDPTHRRAGRTLRALGRAVVAATGTWRFSVRGELPRDLDRAPCVFVANHCSLADPFLLSYLPCDVRFVAKAELFRAPLVGWLLRLGGDIPVSRDGSSGPAMTRACVDTLRKGLSVMIFAEGTRSRSGVLHPFKNGAFHTAVAAGARVVPVALHGTQHCIGAHGPRPATAWAEVLPAIAPDHLGVEALRDRAHAAIASALVTGR
jgi:1-acyl-sn-glycerol-3-phosphate acyltransferase